MNTVKCVLKVIGFNLLLTLLLAIPLYIFERVTEFKYVEFNYIIYTASYLIYFPYLYWLFKKTKITYEQKPFNTKWLLLSILLGVIVFALNKADEMIIGAHGNFNFNIIKLLSGIILAPIFEELFWRLWMTKYMERHKVSIWVIALVPAFLFWFGHANFLIGKWRIDSFLSALIFFFAYRKTSDIRYSMIIHAIGNLLIDVFPLII